MRYIIMLTFIFLMSSFNSVFSKMDSIELIISTMEMSHSCHEGMMEMEHSMPMSMDCKNEKENCSTKCLIDCAQSTSFIAITKIANIPTEFISQIKVEMLPQLYKSMKLSNLFRPPIA